MRTTRRGCNVRRLSEPSPFQMGLQVSRSVRAQTTTESDLRPIPGPIGRDLPRTGEAEGECQIVEGHLMPDHVHMCIAIPPKHPVASVIGFLKRKSAIAIARLGGKERNFSGEHFWARGYAVSTVGFELEQVRQYIREQEAADGNNGSF